MIVKLLREREGSKTMSWGLRAASPTRRQKDSKACPSWVELTCCPKET